MNKNSKIIILSIIILFAIGIIIVQDAEGALPANRIKNIIKVEGFYGNNTATTDVRIDPPITNLAKTFVFMSFSHTGEDDHSDTFRSWDLINSTNLRIYGESTATGNNPEEFTAYIIEFEGTVVTQQSTRTWATSETAGEKSVTISSVNTTATMVVNKGHNHNADETTIGSEELDRIRLLTSTTWGQLIFTNPNTSPQINRVDVVDWKDNTIAVQRGIVTMANGVTLTGISPATAVDRTRTILLVSYAFGTGGTTTEEPDDFMLRATLNSTNKIVITRNSSEDDMQIAWELIQFPATQVKVTYDQMTLAGGTLVQTDTLTTPVRDYDKSIAFSPVSTPFGYSTGTTDTVTAGAIDRAMTHIILEDNNLVQAERGDSTGTMNLEYEVVEFLEPIVAQNAQGTNKIHQIVKIDGTYTAGNNFQDFTISPALTNINKTLVFMSVNSTNNGANHGSSVYGKTWQILNNTALRVFGSQDNVEVGAKFTANIVEFTQTSPIFTQYDQLQYPVNTFDVNKTMAMSTINKTNSFILPMGESNGGSDPTIGDEEFHRLTITNGTRWLDQEDAIQNEGGTVLRSMITDWNQNNIFVQHGNGTLTGTVTTVTPPTAIDRTKSLLFVSYMTSNDVHDAFPSNSTISATLNSANNIVIGRSATGASIPFAYELVTFPSNFISVQHGIHNKTAGVVNSTSTVTSVGVLANSIAIGTVSNGILSLSAGSGSSTVASDFDTTTGRIKLENPTTVRFIRGDGTGTWNVGFQVLEFINGTTFTKTIVDSATTTDQEHLRINKTAVDVGSTIDLSQNKTITKKGSDLVSTSDQVIRVGMFVIRKNDTSTTTDVIHFNVTKKAIDSAITSDTTHFTTTKKTNDTATVSDTEHTNTTKRAVDIASATDLTRLNGTKRNIDVVSVLDNINFNTTKIFLDTVAVIDTSTVTTTRGANGTDIVTTTQNINLNVTKMIQDVTSVTDNVIIIRLIDLKLNDTVVVTDPSIIFHIATVVPNGTGTGGGGGGGGGIPTFHTIIGLSISSEYFHVKAGDVVPSDFIIQTFGQETDEVKLLSIEPDESFRSWFKYSAFPDTLNFETVFDSSRPTSDPSRVKNTALDDFVLNIPNVQCKNLKAYETRIPCIDKVVYDAPMIFTFKKGGTEFREKHIVKIDATEKAECDYICEFNKFVTANWWWLAGLLIIFMIMYFGITASKNKKIRVFTRPDRNYFTSFSADKPRKKFKRGKR